jgi:tetratricopeptide (TPR) repeat protein
VHQLITLILGLLISLSIAANDLAPAFDAYAARDYDTAIEQLERLSEEKSNRDALFHLALFQYRLARFDEANETVERLLETYPKDADAHYLSGLVYLALLNEVNIFRKVSMAKKSLAAWRRAVEIVPDHVNARYAIFAYYANAPSIAGGDLEVAKNHQLDIERINAGFGAMAKGMLLSKETDHEATEAAFRKAISLENRAGPHFALAQFYMQTNQWENAIVEANAFLKKEKRWWDPDITIAHLMLARANAELGNRDLAEKEIDLALALKPNRQIKKLLEETLESL